MSLKSPLPMAEDEFSIIVIPDTQELAARHPATFRTMTRWIADHAEQLHVRMILHLGDVVDHGAINEDQFRAAEEALQTIYSAGLPMLLAPGNHDYDNLLQEDRSLAMFNRYFGLHRYEGRPWFGGCFEEGKAENSYATLDILGANYLFMTLEFGPRDEVLAWADDIVSKHPDHTAIIATHCYMYMYGERCKPGDAHNPKDYPGAFGANDGEDQWHKCYKKHRNILAVFSGHHIKENVSYCMERGEQGNPVLQSFQNWQYAENGGEGRIRIVKLRPSANEMKLYVYNALKNTYEQTEGYEVDLPISTDGELHSLRYPAAK